MQIHNLLNDAKRFKIKNKILPQEEEKISINLIDIHFVKIPIVGISKNRKGIPNVLKKIFKINNYSLKFEELYLTLKLYDKLDEIIKKLKTNNIEIDKYDKITLNISVFVTTRNIYAVIFDYVILKYENNKSNSQKCELEDPIIIPISDFDIRLLLIKKLYEVTNII